MSPIPAPAAPCRIDGSGGPSHGPPIPPRAAGNRPGKAAAVLDVALVFVPDFFGQALNGLSYGVLLLPLSVGRTLLFGMLDVVNLAHGSFYMLGAYAGLATIGATGNFWLALVVAPLAVGVIGAVMERLVLRPPYVRSPLHQGLLTFGVILLFQGPLQWILGGRL